MTIHRPPPVPTARPSPLAGLIAAGSRLYRRDAMLPRLLPVAPGDLGPDTPSVARDLCRRLARALREERARGRAGHWSYSLDRHVGLAQALRAERDHLARLEAAAKEKGAAGGRAPRSA